MKGCYYIVILVCALTLVRPAHAYTLDADRLFVETNARRTAHGASLLSRDPELDRIAMEKAKSIFALQEFGHEQNGKPFFTFFDDAGYKYEFAGENLAIDYFNEAELTQAWMDSPTHRANIVDPRYTHSGLAVLDGVLHKQYTIVVVQLFSKPEAASAVATPFSAMLSSAGTIPQEAKHFSMQGLLYAGVVAALFAIRRHQHHLHRPI